MIFRAEETVLVQGITGRQATFWTERMRDYGTRIVGGVNPRKAGETHLDLPVWASAVDAAKEAKIDAAVMFIPALGVKAAAMDAIAAGIGKLVILTEHVPVQDVMEIMAAARDGGTQVLGPNTAGTVTPGANFVGFMPAFNEQVFRPGRVGVMSRSGSLGTLICLKLTEAGLGQSAFIGIGGDPIIGTTTADAVAALAAHDGTDAIVVVGEIGGTMEEDAAEAVANAGKPVVAFFAGRAAPAGRKMGHAGAIVSGGRGTYDSKRVALEAAGAVVLDTPSDVGEAVAKGLESASRKAG
jgi:succinyl-CoA synthetase alpha subunit